MNGEALGHSATPPPQIGRMQSARWQVARRAFYRFSQSYLSVSGLFLAVLLVLIAIFGPAFVPYPDHVAGGIEAGARFQPPSPSHWFGTNELGQDVFSLVIAGSRISLLAGVAIVLFGLVVGTLIGAVAGYCGGLVDEIAMRFTDLILTVPSIVLAMAISTALGQGTYHMILAIALTWWPPFARLVRGEVMVKKQALFVQASRALGASAPRLVICHILPNIMSPVIIKASLDMGFAILTVAGLGFIGIGVRPPVPEWGSLLSQARFYMLDYWWTAAFPGLAIFIAVMAFNLLGDGLRDVLDPKARR